MSCELLQAYSKNKYSDVSLQAWYVYEKQRFHISNSNGPSRQHGLTLIAVWKSKYMPSEVLGEITYPTQTSTVVHLMFGNEWVISSRVWQCMSRIPAGIKVSPCW